MLKHEAAADMRLVRRINTGMKIQAGGEHMGCGGVREDQKSQVICLQCQDEGVRVCPGSPRSPRCAIATRLSSGSADREPSSGSYNVSSGTFYSCVSQITIEPWTAASYIVLKTGHPGSSWKSGRHWPQQPRNKTSLSAATVSRLYCWPPLPAQQPRHKACLSAVDVVWTCFEQLRDGPNGQRLDRCAIHYPTSLINSDHICYGYHRGPPASSIRKNLTSGTIRQSSTERDSE
ncbi:uncharacterized protein [Labrus bergylta]|uniref:uncharacterized protein n=1 Tax=Labrus bergylta TaxID=56723 RepID=UPI003313D111